MNRLEGITYFCCTQTQERRLIQCGIRSGLGRKVLHNAARNRNANRTAEKRRQSRAEVLFWRRYGSRSPWCLGLGGMVLLAWAVWLCTSQGNRRAAGSVVELNALLKLPPSARQQVDIARMNLLCAQGLPGAEGVDLAASLAELDKMAARVRSETERHLYRFQTNPAEFENSEGFFRMVMLAVVLAEDFGVRYAPSKIGTAPRPGWVTVSSRMPGMSSSSACWANGAVPSPAPPQ